MNNDNVKVLGGLELATSLTFEKNYTDFPENPTPRMIVVKNGLPYIYTELVANSGFFSWMPIGSRQASYVHVQSVPSTEWIVTHNFDSTHFGYFVYDEAHKLVIANVEVVNSLTAKVKLYSATSGTAVFFSVESIQSQAVYAAQELSVGQLTLRDKSGTLTVNNNDVALAAGYYTKTEIDAFISSLQAEIASALETAKTYTDQKIANVNANVTSVSNALSSEVTRAQAVEADLQNQIDNILENTDPAALDSLTEIVAAFQQADGNLQAAVLQAASGAEANAKAYTDSEIAQITHVDTTNTVTSAAQPNITSVGTLISLNVSGNVIASRVSANLAGNGFAITNINASNVSGKVANAAYSDDANYASFAGYVVQSNQANITQVGQLISLNVGNATANTSFGNGTVTTKTVTTTDLFATRLYGEAGNLSNISGSNVTGTVGNASHAQSANIVTNASQTIITQVGTLVGLTSSGVVNVNNSTDSTSPTTGALKVTGGAGVVGNVNVGGNLTANTSFTMNSGNSKVVIKDQGDAPTLILTRTSNAVVTRSGTIAFQTTGSTSSIWGDATIYASGGNGQIASALLHFSASTSNFGNIKSTGQVWSDTSRVEGTATLSTTTESVRSTSLVMNTPTTIFDFSTTNTRSVKLLVEVAKGEERQFCEMVVTTNGTVATHSVYASAETAGELASFATTLNSGSVLVNATAPNADTTVKVRALTFNLI